MKTNNRKIYLVLEIRDTFSDTLTFKLSLQIKGKCMENRGRSFQGQGTNRCTGLEARRRLAHLRN
jgi:hypothetical protein